MIEQLQAKKKAAKKAMSRDGLVESRAATMRYIKNIELVCDRLTFNFNMLPASEKYLTEVTAEAERFIDG
jgi:hypothetical protein